MRRDRCVLMEVQHTGYGENRWCEGFFVLVHAWMTQATLKNRTGIHFSLTYWTSQAQRWIRQYMQGSVFDVRVLCEKTAENPLFPKLCGPLQNNIGSVQISVLLPDPSSHSSIVDDRWKRHPAQSLNLTTIWSWNLKLSLSLSLYLKRSPG